MRSLSAQDECAYTIVSMCGLFGRSKQAYYQFDSEGLAERLAKEAFAIEKAKEVRDLDHGIGCANIWRIYIKEFEGEKPLGRDRFLSLLYENGFRMREAAKSTRTTDSRHNLPLYPNLVKSLIPTSPNRVWVSDITYIPIVRQDGGHNFCYLTTIIDACSRKEIAHEVGASLHTHHSLRCLQRAIAAEGADRLNGLIHHSDRGVQYASLAYTETLKRHGISISMTQTGSPKDNPQAERINSTVKNELLKGMVFTSIEQVREAVDKAFDFYNNRRPHMSIDYMTPSEAHKMNSAPKERWVSYRKLAIVKANAEVQQCACDESSGFVLSGAARRAPAARANPTARSE